METVQNIKLETFPLCPSREESEAMKGVFIILIVMAHNTLLIPTSSPLQNYFYQFHYFSFFILPFLYPRSSLTLQRTINYFIRFYVPYFWFFLVTYLAYSVVWLRNGFDLIQFLSVFWRGEISQIKQVTGFHFLWFLPAFFIFSLLRDIYSTSGKIVRILLFSISILVHFSAYLGLPSYAQLRLWIPLGIVQSLFLFPMGVISVSILRYVPRFRLRADHESIHRIYAGCLALLVFAILSFDFMENPGLGAATYSEEIRNILLAVFFFTLIYIFRREFSRIRLLRVLGKYSLEIYLFHLFIYNGLMYLVHVSGWTESLFMGLIILCATLLLTLILILILQRSKVLQKILFPKELIHFKRVLQ
ncbi:acyltransferase family protein [Parabacteroides sp. FAFU027]|uniref:acyltransferase family protein n=1 Tax=Parabacteroides sp. FAFU027 TaxID=2922715 RepID=UPI00397DEC1B